MDRMIAFGAGAVLSFGVGYLVGYSMHDSATIKDEGTAPIDTSDVGGVIDAQISKLKSLVDLSNQADESLTTDLSNAELRDLKSMVLPHLTPRDIAAWPTARDQFVAKFIRTNAEIWAVGSDEAANARFDQGIAHAAEGAYEGQITVVGESGDAKPTPIDFVVELRGYDSKTPDGHLAFHAADGSPIWGKQFRWQHIGTDVQSRSVWLIWPDFDRRTEGQFTHLAVRLPSGLTANQASTSEVYGLTPELTWAKCGSAEVLKTK